MTLAPRPAHDLSLLGRFKVSCSAYPGEVPLVPGALGPKAEEHERVPGDMGREGNDDATLHRYGGRSVTVAPSLGTGRGGNIERRSTDDG